MSRELEVATGVRGLTLDLPPLVGAFTRRLHDAGMPVGPARATWLARALALEAPVARRRLYFTARAVLVSDPAQMRVFDAVFAEVFGAGTAAGELAAPAPEMPAGAPATAAQAPPGPELEGAGAPAARASIATGARPDSRALELDELALPVLASDEELLRDKRFDALDAGELAMLSRLIARLALSPPVRLTRRQRRDRHGRRIDLRRTLRDSRRSGGEPVRLTRRRRIETRRRLVMLCDISGSMEPYARAYLQLLVCAVGSSRRAEAFAFATRLTRLTRALRGGRADRAMQRAAATAPDWSSGTRIADALKAFNDGYGRRGIARGSVVVIISDGWERGDPAGVAREMARLARVAHRIVWVNPRVAAAGFEPRAGGMAAALPHVDALLSGHTLEALEELADVIAAPRVARGVAVEPPGGGDAEPWASATPIPGSSVAMPSGYGPRRGLTTPGWSHG